MDAIKKIFKTILNKKAVMVLVTCLILVAVATGSVLAYSIKLKQDGDKEYKNQNYQASLHKYEEARAYWIPEKISLKFRDRDLYTKINKAKIMVKSADNYEKGLEAFEQKQYKDALTFFAAMAVNDPNYQKAQTTIKEINRLLNQQAIILTKPQRNKTQEIQLPTSTYSDLHCPRLISVEDSLGNKGSGNLHGTFRKGSVNILTVKIIVVDPQNKELYYAWSSENLTGQKGEHNWSKDNTFTIDVTNVYVGANKNINVEVDNQDGYGCLGSDFDTSSNFYYDITP